MDLDLVVVARQRCRRLEVATDRSREHDRRLKDEPDSPPELAHGSVRFSLSKESTESEVMEGARVVGECVARLRKSGGIGGSP